MENPKNSQPTNTPVNNDKPAPAPNPDEPVTKKPAPKPILKKPTNPTPAQKNNTKTTSAHPTNPIFISKPLRNPYAKSLTKAMKAMKKYCTYIKIWLPKIQSGVPAEQETEVTTSFSVGDLLSDSQQW